jgi:uncharacterized membrane protein
MEEKYWFQSRTIIGVAVMLLSQVLRYFKVDIVSHELADIITISMDAIGALLAVYGRIGARKKLKMTKPGGSFNPKAEVRKAKKP